MASKLINRVSPEISAFQLALQTTKYELNYERSARAVECVAKDEDIRKLRLQLLLLEDENDELNDQLEREQKRGDELEHSVNDAWAQLEESETEVQRVSNELRMKVRELDTVKAELTAMESMSSDSTKLLTEKLALARELSTLKPELEHLRTQVTSNQGLLSEKLSLQRQLNTIQVELENEKRAVQKALAKEGKKGEQDKELRSQIEDLKNELKISKREQDQTSKVLNKAESALEFQKQECEKIQKSLVKAHSDLEDAKSSAQRSSNEADSEQKEKKDPSAEAQKSLLDDKLNQFRTKLKSTKEKLKETEAQLEAAQASAPARHSSVPVLTEKPTKNPRKRTPGDMPTKRNKRGSSALPGDKSTFSITPFLNRTASVAIDGLSDDDEVKPDADKPIKSTELAIPDKSPSAKPKKATRKATAPKSKPLGSSEIKANSKARKKPAVPTLAMVTEDAEEFTEAEKVPPETDGPNEAEKENNIKPKLKASSQPKKAPRKSLLSFADFTAEPEPEKKKKRKNLGGGKTLFDVEDESGPTKPMPGKGLFGARAFAKGLGGGLGGLGGSKKGLGKGLIKGGFLMTDDGFQFSPLKKDKRAASVTIGD
ncbi:hypothetical protein M501DRAFT_1026885 [Patellaria atrata CBS 101060]|uniref:Uncharacterized protein n=1 Tax=Patellaria atrata CBS 101060 TaxID=1346257 RepID=A0A9P4S2V2_9PEZI|nr:hypothetical protein M501DRAFT_1026885 [Patellaria atrata CBS 101060]